MIISAPFGNYFNFRGTINTVGTYTLDYRAGFLKRFWKIASTVRYDRRTQSCINKLELPNPGIAKAPKAQNNIISIAGFSSIQWINLIQSCIELGYKNIELNISCPNINKGNNLHELKSVAQTALREKVNLIAKLPPVKWLEIGDVLWNYGISTFHLCNTIPTPGGGLSGKVLKQYSLWAIEDFKRVFKDQAKLIGGGGISRKEDIQDYLNAGADEVAIGSMLFNPLNWLKIREFVEYLNEKNNNKSRAFIS